MAAFILLNRREPETDPWVQCPKKAANMCPKNLELAPSL